MSTSNEWNLQAGAWKDGNSEFGRRLEDQIMRNPEWVLHMRRDERFRCPDHWDQPTGTTNSTGAECPFCYGFGTKVSFEINPCRIERDRGTMGPQEGEQRQYLGWINVDTVIADFPRWVRPSEQDLIVVCEWTVPTTEIVGGKYLKPDRVVDVYQIKKVNAHFERELALFNCGLELYPIEDRRLREVINRLPALKANRGKEWRPGSFW